METNEITLLLSRIREVVDRFSRSDRAFCNAIGFSEQTFNHYMKDGKMPSVKLLLCILNSFPDINANWLMCGRGPMFIDGDKDKEVHDAVSQAIEILANVKK